MFSRVNRCRARRFAAGLWSIRSHDQLHRAAGDPARARARRNARDGPGHEPATALRRRLHAAPHRARIELKDPRSNAEVTGIRLWGADSDRSTLALDVMLIEPCDLTDRL